MTGEELTVFNSESILTGFEYIISSTKAFHPNSGFSESQLVLLAGTCGEAIKSSSKSDYLDATHSPVSIFTPESLGISISSQNSDFLDTLLVAMAELNYLIVTQPDIAYAVSVVSQFTSAPTVKHWAALEQILCYLKKVPGLAILYSGQGHTRIECFSDVDWAGSKFDRRSTTGYCVFFGGNLVAWKSKKQSVVSRSSAESEYRAMAQATCEIIWIHQLLCEVGMKCTMPAKLWCDNQAALHIAANLVYHERTKHIEVDCHCIREKIEENLVSTGYVKTGEQLGDIFTKALNGTQVDYFCNKLGMINIYALA
eukprot:XP_019078480.1 PREDICTED: uncharacterized protein LOC109123382 [Vitis vinifera]